MQQWYILMQQARVARLTGHNERRAKDGITHVRPYSGGSPHRSHHLQSGYGEVSVRVLQPYNCIAPRAFAYLGPIDMRGLDLLSLG